ncbi:unnamed protein product [Brassica oleracea]|uniref:(rape) hypothetical protein n=1 Tax=Brassica napus TaxID=3708 RepID=A0A816R2L9_BRANA|nr:unnamed protein product [Brassica napus]
MTVWFTLGKVMAGGGELPAFVPLLEWLNTLSITATITRSTLLHTILGKSLFGISLMISHAKMGIFYLLMSGEVPLSMVDSRWQFCIYAYDPLTKTRERVNDLGDEALILDMGFTVVAKDIPGIKRNSIYFSGINMDHQSKDPEHIFVYDLGTQTTERLPQWVVSSVGFSDARWFFPDTNH